MIDDKNGDLVAVLDAHDQLVWECLAGKISMEEFVREYDSFYPRYALDGHEAADDDERNEIASLEMRIAPHREIWEHIIGAGLTETDEISQSQRDAGRFGYPEAHLRLREIAKKYPHLSRY